jgi:hypothetical protein
MNATNKVTPGDVGKRVTFQYILPNGMSKEAVGTLEFWDAAAATYMVRHKDGALMRVPARDVKHGKLVG